MDEKSKIKIKLFKEQYPQYTLLTIGNGDDRENYLWKPDIYYKELEKIYINLIPLWETNIQNLKKYPELYNENWIEGKREKKRKHHKLLKLDNNFNLKIGFLWSHQPFKQRPTFNKKSVKTFYIYDENNNIIVEDENWGSILSKCKQYIKDNAVNFYKNYIKIRIKSYCKSENICFDIVEFDILKNKWFI